jgi:hypothetical protein
MSFSTHSRILFSAEYFHYKIFFHEKCLENKNDNFQENLSRPGMIDAKARYRAAGRPFSNTALGNSREAKHLSDTFPIKHVLTQGDALSPLLFALNLKYDFSQCVTNKMQDGITT